MLLSQEWVASLIVPQVFESPCGEQGNPKTFLLPLSAPGVHNVQFLSSPLPSSPRWVSIS